MMQRAAAWLLPGGLLLAGACGGIAVIDGGGDGTGGAASSSSQSTSAQTTGPTSVVASSSSGSTDLCGGVGTDCSPAMPCSGVGLMCLNGMCLPPVGGCGGFANAQCEEPTPLCVLELGGNVGYCFTEAQLDCACSHPAADETLLCP